MTEKFLFAQGTTAPEVQAARAANGAAAGGTAYVNLETGDCPGDLTGIQAILSTGVARVVVGLLHPLKSQRGVAVDAWRGNGVTVDVLEEAPCAASPEALEETVDAIALANEALLHRAVLRRPMGILKYAMTLDGKIAASSGHSAWVSSPDSRRIVFDTRSRCDAVIVGGQTVRRDNPRLTTRREGGHQPIRIVMSRTLDLPVDAALWDVEHAPTVVATQRGARQNFQSMLRSRNVEVVEFDFLTPDAVAEYCYTRGFLSLLWECGGTLAAPAIAGGAIHKTMAFIAPKMIGGSRAPTPVGDLGFVEMTQALELTSVSWRQVGPDLLVSGYLPRSRGPRSLADSFQRQNSSHVRRPSTSAVKTQFMDASFASPTGSGMSSNASAMTAIGLETQSGMSHSTYPPKRTIEFYKSWDTNGILSNFTAHPISMPEAAMNSDKLEKFRPLQCGESAPEGWREWPSVEHYYQAQKFAEVDHEEARAAINSIASADSPELAAAIGRRLARTRPELLRKDWQEGKIAAMHAALRAKFFGYEGPRDALMRTAGTIEHVNGRQERTYAMSPNRQGMGISAGGESASGVRCISRPGVKNRRPDTAAHIVENSPHDFFWGKGVDGSGENNLGRLLEIVREELHAAFCMRE